MRKSNRNFLFFYNADGSTHTIADRHAIDLQTVDQENFVQWADWHRGGRFEDYKTTVRDRSYPNTRAEGANQFRLGLSERVWGGISCSGSQRWRIEIGQGIHTRLRPWNLYFYKPFFFHIYIYIHSFIVLDGIDQESSTTICVNESATAWQHDELDRGQ